MFFRGVEISENDLNRIPPFTGLNFIVCGEFDHGSEFIKQQIKEFGGKTSDSYDKKVTTILLGKDGKTAYGQPTGSKSKKYKAAKKAKKPVVDYDWILKKIENFQNGTEEEEEEKEEVNEKKRKK